MLTGRVLKDYSEVDEVVSTVSSDKGADCVSREWKASPTLWRIPPFWHGMCGKTGD